MNIDLRKKTGINLKKGSTISLEKKGVPLSSVCFGLNWGAIQRTGVSKFLFGNTTVDLDGSVTQMSGGKHVDTVSFMKLSSTDGSIRHSGDDRTGDVDGDDGLDNEVIRINLSKVNPKVDTIWIYLNSYKHQNFAEIPFSKIRVYEGIPSKIKDVLATFDLSSKPEFASYVSMIMGKLVRNGGTWTFEALGEPIPAKNIQETVQFIKDKLVPA